jgi:transposase InsO family protein
MDDYSQYIHSWKLCPTMQAVEAERTLEKTIQEAGLPVEKRPRILTDNGSAYVSKYLKEYFHEQNIRHTRCAPHHPRQPVMVNV